MPADNRLHNKWLGAQVEHVDKNPKDLNPVLKEFADMVKSSPKMRMLAEAMFDEVPHRGYVISCTVFCDVAVHE